MIWPGSSFYNCIWLNNISTVAATTGSKAWSQAAVKYVLYFTAERVILRVCVGVLLLKKHIWVLQQRSSAMANRPLFYLTSPLQKRSLVRNWTLGNQTRVPSTIPLGLSFSQSSLSFPSVFQILHFNGAFQLFRTFISVTLSPIL